MKAFWGSKRERLRRPRFWTKRKTREKGGVDLARRLTRDSPGTKAGEHVGDVTVALIEKKRGKVNLSPVGVKSQRPKKTGKGRSSTSSRGKSKPEKECDHQGGGTLAGKQQVSLVRKRNETGNLPYHQIAAGGDSGYGGRPTVSSIHRRARETPGQNLAGAGLCYFTGGLRGGGEETFIIINR